MPTITIDAADVIDQLSDAELHTLLTHRNINAANIKWGEAREALLQAADLLYAQEKYGLSARLDDIRRQIFT